MELPTAPMFGGAPERYDRFMGRYSGPLAVAFAGFAGIRPGQRVLDVGCGPGALTGELVGRVGAGSVAAVDPSESFATANRERHPGVEVIQAPAEALPFPDAGFDASLAQLVVHFMADPVAGLSEMRRVTRAGGIVAACVWDHAADGGPLARFWSAARELEPGIDDESNLAGAHEGDLGRLFREAGLSGIEEATVETTVAHPGFEDWWEPYTLGVGPAGAYVRSLDAEGRQQLRDRCAAGFPAGGLTVTARAWAARARA